jgi:hypothetical protein
MKGIILLLIFTGAFVVPAFAQYPTVVAGIGLDPVVLPDSSGAPVLFWTFGAEGLFSLKTRLGENASFSLFTKIKGGILLDSPVAGLDAELVSAELGLATGPGRVVLRTIFNSSFLGTMTSEITYHPEWEARYYFLAAPGRLNPYIAYHGFVRVRPESATDIFSEGAELGFEYRPSFLEEYAIGLRGSWENWYDAPLYLPGGLPADSLRNDFLAELILKAGGIVGLFLDWDVELAFSVRLSDANAYLAGFSYLNENSESAATVSLLPSFDWAPVKALALKARPLASGKLYLDRRAVSAGALTADRAFVLSAGGSFEFDWAPGDALHLTVRIDGEWRHSNDDALREWKLEASGGVKFSFDFPPAAE